MDHVRGAARSEDVRAHNLAAVLTYLDLVGRASRADLSGATGLVSGAVSLLVQELRDAGLVRPAELPEDTGPARRGRPTEIVEIDGAGTGFLVVQFLMDQVTVLAADLAGRVLHRSSTSVTTPRGDPAALAGVLAGPVREGLRALQRQDVDLVSVALVAPAPVDPLTGRVAWSTDFGWEEADLGGLLAARLPATVPAVTVLNDAQTATHAETVALRRAGDGAPVDHLVYLKADTGIGGGAVVDGRLLRGTSPYTFQPGHMVVVPGGEACSCGKRGCLVTVAGPDVLLRAAGLDAVVRDRGAPAALAELFRRVDTGDPAAGQALAETLGWVRLALGNVCVLLQPDVVVLGGYLSRSRETLLGRTGVDPLGAPGLPGDPRVLPSHHGDESALQGAMSLIRETALGQPFAARR